MLPLEFRQRTADPTDKIVRDLNERYINTKKKEFHLKDLVILADLLRQWGCSNL